MGNETLPFRINLKPIKFFEKPIEFEQITPKLKFITNKKRVGSL